MLYIQIEGGFQSVKVSFAFCLLLLVCSFPALPSMASKEPDVHAIAQAVDNHYNHLRSLQADFAEVYRGNGMDRNESGTLWLKKPRKMRWEYRSPKQKLFLSDGETAWFYVPGEHQARKEPFKKLEDLRSPLGFLLGKTKLEKELKGLSLAPDVAPLAAEDVVLRGLPNGMQVQISEVLLEITPDKRIVRIVLQGTDDATTEYRLTDQKENVAVADERFHFAPPPGVETIEGDLGQ
ncbi:MAG TPA: outer membrane lipoprotein chaperone LolA [Terriglobales bacterium]|nr:outer membrane lipoprotein chaperone LolA [Terriglobales bacterium]